MELWRRARRRAAAVEVEVGEVVEEEEVVVVVVAVAMRAAAAVPARWFGDGSYIVPLLRALVWLRVGRQPSPPPPNATALRSQTREAVGCLREAAATASYRHGWRRNGRGRGLVFSNRHLMRPPVARYHHDRSRAAQAVA